MSKKAHFVSLGCKGRVYNLEGLHLFVFYVWCVCVH